MQGSKSKLNSVRRGVMLCLLMLASCSPIDDFGSDLSVKHGRHIQNDDKNPVKGVVLIRAHVSQRQSAQCSATVVSTNTLITAAHCVPGSVNQLELVRIPVCVVHPKPDGELCSKSVYRPRGYGQDSNLDIAVVIFPQDSFKHFFELDTERQSLGDHVFMVGYSFADLGNLGRAQVDNGESKRWGWNVVSRVGSGGSRDKDVVYSNYGSRVSATMVTEGDSGGPLFSNTCKLTGVASRRAESGRNEMSLHTNAASGTPHEWLKTMLPLGANICGLPGTDA